MTTGTHKLPTNARTLRVPPSVSPSVGTAEVGNEVTSWALYNIQLGHFWDDSWVLRHDLVVSIQSSKLEVVATTFLTSTVQEYGVGDSVEAAITDLLTSLSDYHESLRDREARLAPGETDDLASLRDLIGMKPSS
jgi:hypothetical protein